MKLKEFAEATGATHRRLDYWSRGGLIFSHRTYNGSGHYRDYDEEFIPHVKLLVKLSKISNHRGGFETSVLKKIFDHYHLGHAELADGVVLTWEVRDRYDNRIDAPPEESPSVPRKRKGLIRWRRNR